MNITIPKLKLILWKKIEMPEKKKDTQGVFQKTGGTTEMTGYLFHDEFHSELYFVSPKNDFRNLEGKTVDLFIKATYDEYNRKNKFVLDGVVAVKA